MNTQRQAFQQDRYKNPEQLQREADDVREDFEHTVEDLIHQFSPGELVNQAIAKFRNGGDNAFIHNLSSQIQNNPLPAILAGASITWLMSASKQPPATPHGSPGHGLSDRAPEVKDKVGEVAGQLKEKTQRARGAVHEQGQQVRSGASDLKQQSGDAGRQAMENARSGVQSARDGYQRLLTEQPLVVGALAVAAGAALGALFPRTNAENRAVGDTSDRHTEALKQKAGEAKEKAESKVEDKLDQHQSYERSAGSSNNAGDSRRQASAGASGPPGHEAATSAGPEQGLLPRESARAPQNSRTPTDHPGTNRLDDERNDQRH